MGSDNSDEPGPKTSARLERGESDGLAGAVGETKAASLSSDERSESVDVGLDPALLAEIDAEFSDLEREIARISGLPNAAGSAKVALLEHLRAEWRKKAEEQPDANKPEWKRRIDSVVSDAVQAIVEDGLVEDGQGNLSFNLEGDSVTTHGKPVLDAFVQGLPHLLKDKFGDGAQNNPIAQLLTGLAQTVASKAAAAGSGTAKAPKPEPAADAATATEVTASPEEEPAAPEASMASSQSAADPPAEPDNQSSKVISDAVTIDEQATASTTIDLGSVVGKDVGQQLMKTLMAGFGQVMGQLQGNAAAPGSASAPAAAAEAQEQQPALVTSGVSSDDAKAQAAAPDTADDTPGVAGEASPADAIAPQAGARVDAAPVRADAIPAVADVAPAASESAETSRPIKVNVDFAGLLGQLFRPRPAATAAATADEEE